MAKAAPRPATAQPKFRPWHVAAVAAGNALEFYDFVVYAFFAAQIGRAFFPSHDASASLLASLATFGAGFVMRPLGALVIGRVGDRAGRKSAMVLTFTLMGAAMIGLALTPSYAAIGLAAPLLAILLRLVQGFALGGEMGPSTAFLLEAAPPHRRGLYVSLQYMSQDAAILAAGLVGLALAWGLTDAALDGWGWRVAFLLGGTVAPFGFMLRLRLSETLGAAGPDVVRPRPRLRRITCLALALLAGGAVVTYVETYLTTYATSTLGMPAETGFLSTAVLGLCSMVFGPLGGWLSDRFGRKPVMIAPWALLLATTLPGFWLVSHLRTLGMLVAWSIILAICVAMALAAILVSIAESLPAGVRSGALGLAYALAISVFGGSTQVIVAWLTELSGDPLAPAWYMSGAVALALFAMVLMPESAPARTAAARSGTAAVHA